MLFELFIVWVSVGLLAQLIDGTLGMAYGVSSTTALVSIGTYPALASASVHTAEIFTTFVSGNAHLKLGNVRLDFIKFLAIPGIIGGITGAYIAVTMTSNILRLVVGGILFFMGLIILFRFIAKHALHFRKEKPSSKMLAGLGYIAALMDALGGGGWGPIATTTLVANKVEPSKAIGSVNFTEFFVTLAESITFILLIGPEKFSWEIILGLIIGGLVCAPIAALACKKISHRLLGIIVGTTVIILSLRMILNFFAII